MRLRRTPTGWEVALRPLFPTPPPPPAGIFPTLTWALYSVAPAVRHYFTGSER